MAVGKGPKGTGSGAAGRSLAPVPPGELANPIVVPNTVWRPENPLAYQGATDFLRQDDARWASSR